MSFYNPHFPLVPPLHTLIHNNNSLAPYLNPYLAYFSPYAFSSTLPLNQKRQFTPSTNPELNEFDHDTYAYAKKYKIDGLIQGNSNNQEFLPSNYAKKQKEVKEQVTKRKKYEVINIDDDRDCLIIEDSPINESKLNTQPFCEVERQDTQNNQKETFNQSNLIIPGSKVWKNLSGSDLLSAQLRALAQSNAFSQNMSQVNPDSLMINQNKSHDMPDAQENYNFPNKPQKFTNYSEIILIQDDIDDGSTCQTSPQCQSTQIQTQINPNRLNNAENKICPEFKPLIRNISKKQDSGPNYSIQYSIDPSKNTDGHGPDHLQVYDLTNNTAIIPKFELSRKSKKTEVLKKVKLVWSPKSLGPNGFENCLQQIEKALGMQITDEEKVIKTLEKYNNNIDVALGMIKRHKAQYKNYFRVKKLERVQKPYSHLDEYMS